ncbi:hypothetical protein F8M41_021541 [Gigaspora margarita]|uniref:Uncharacterized protein n=1 Tax=Gigaspora margarita TaxID=4874 RepID=A0A8H4AGL1_GIGMA|nr:hypothetical protein F8M41_021541 [Gigaspora margarita]
MVKLPKILETPDNFNDIVNYIQHRDFAEKYNSSIKKLNFKRRCKNFLYNLQTGHLFLKQPSKGENSLPIIKRVVPTYDTELKDALFEKFHIGASHFDYYKTYTMTYEQYIGITQNEVEKYVNDCSTWVRNRSIKEKSDLTPVVSNGPLEHFKSTWLIFYPMLRKRWDEITRVQGYHWIDVLLQFVIAYNKAPHQAHKKSPYEAFFGFKMHVVYSTPADDITLADDITPADVITPADDIMPVADITPADTDITPADITPDITLADTIFASQNNSDNRVSYEFHTMQVICVHEKVLQNDETYQNKLVICRSVHRRKLMFDSGDKVAIAYDHDNNQKMQKQKLKQTCNNTGTVVSMCSNNRTVRVEVDGKVKTFAAKNLKKLNK